MTKDKDSIRAQYIKNYFNKLLGVQRELLKELFKNQVYVYPELHDKLEEKLKAFSSEKIVKIVGEDAISKGEIESILKDQKDKRKYYILTHEVSDDSERQIQYLATKEIAELVSSMMDAYREDSFKLYEKDKEIQRLKGKDFIKPFQEKNGDLLLYDYGTIRFEKRKDPYFICKTLFKNKTSISHIWAIDDFADIFRKEYSKPGRNEPIDLYKAIELKIRRINNRIRDFTDGEVYPLIKHHDMQVFVNPRYFHLFK